MSLLEVREPFENLSFTGVAKNLGYKSIFKIRNKLHLKGQVSKFLKSKDRVC